MPSTFSTNLKIELMATGENSGTWGTVTNTNLGTALEQAVVGYGNPNYSSDANLTITLTDSNAAQAARALVLNVTSSVSLTGTRELVVPTIQKQYIVQNNTTGSQSITVKTSAGTGVTIPNGKKMHVYVNGTDVVQMDDFALIFNVDNLTLDGNTLSSTDTNGNIVIAPNGTGDVQLDADTVRVGDSNANATITTNGTGDLILNTNAGTNSGSITIEDGVNGNIIIAPNGTGQVQITNAALDLTTIEVSNINARDGTAAITIADSTGAVGISTAVTMSATTQNIALGTSQTTGTFTVGGAAQTGTQTFDQSTKTHTLNLGTGATESGLTKTINLGTAGVSGSTTAITVGSANGTTTTLNGTVTAATLNSTTIDTTNIEVTNIKAKDGTAALSIADSTGAVTVATALTANGGAVFNENGADVDFRVESDTDTHCLFVDASANNVGIGTSSPGQKLVVVGNINAVSTANVGAAGSAIYYLGGANAPTDAEFKYDTATRNLSWKTAASASDILTLNASGNLGLGVAPSAWNGMRALQINAYGSAITAWNSNSNTYILSNAYYDAAFKFSTTATASAVYYNASGETGVHSWYTAGSPASRTAGNAISFTQAMTLDASGNLLVGETSASAYTPASSGKEVFISGDYLTSWANNRFIGMPFNDGANYKLGIELDADSRCVNIICKSLDAGGGDRAIKFFTGQTPTQAMTLDASGRLLVGPTSAASVGNANFAVTGGSVYDGNFSLIAQLTNDTTAAGKGVLLGFNNSTNTGIISAAYGNGSESLAFWTHNNTSWGERARITSGGNFGIGVTNPGSRLQVETNGTYVVTLNNTADDARIELQRAGTQFGQLSAGNNFFNIVASGASTAIRFLINSGSTQAMTLDASGRLLIGGTSSPASSNIRLLLQSPNATSDGGAQFAYNGGGGGGGAIFSATGSGLVFFGYTGVVGSETYTERARITSTGMRVGLFNGVGNSTWYGYSAVTNDLGGSTGNVGLYLDAPYNAGTTNTGFFRTKRGAGDTYNGTEIGVTSVFRILTSTTEDTNERVRVGNSEMVVNEPGNDYDFRVESDTDTHCLFVDASTNCVGIGTNAPTFKLDVSVTNTTAYSTTAYSFEPVLITNLGAGGVSGLLLQAVSTGTSNTAQATISAFAESASSKDTALAFGTRRNSDGAVLERARITSGGDLLVGQTTTSSPGDGNTTQGSAIQAPGKAYFSSNTSRALTLNRNEDGNVAAFFRSGAEVGSISVTTTATAYNTSSDYRLKDNPQPLTGSGEFIDALQPKTWDWKSGGKGVGFIAHEAQAVSPSSVTGTKDAVDADGKPIMQAMEYGSAEFIANIIAELQSLRARVAQLEGK